VNLEPVVHLLRCPVCAAGFTLESGALRCTSGHSFDIARQGYVNLLNAPEPANADTATMLSARSRFLNADFYAPIASVVAGFTGTGSSVEVGAGTGYYLSHVSADDRLAVDVSKAAAKTCARAGLPAIVADTWAGLPIRNDSFENLLCVFAPRNPAEFARILKPGGVGVIAFPTSRHLHEARESLGLLGIQDDKAAIITDQMTAAGFTPDTETLVEYDLNLDPSALTDLIEMGPNAFHVHRVPRTKLTLTVSVQVSRFRAPVTSG
jgi:23S rRNA (guanine745-N1)-methyltransferase